MFAYICHKDQPNVGTWILWDTGMRGTMVATMSNPKRECLDPKANLDVSKFVTLNHTEVLNEYSSFLHVTFS